MRRDPTHLGSVAQVKGATISVLQEDSLASGMAIIGGTTYRVGQVGSFVRIPQGYQDLFGIVSQIGADAAPEGVKGEHQKTSRWLTVQLVGESVAYTFDRGISQYPSIGDAVHVVVEEDLKKIYGKEGEGQIKIGQLASSSSIDARVDLDRLLTRHSVVVGSTGSGKSTTVASLLRSITGEPGTSRYPSARILLLDIHGEYARALGDVAQVFRINADEAQSELFVPYWALEFEELATFLVGDIEDSQAMHLRDKIVELKVDGLKRYPRPGADPGSLTVDSPVPFSLNQLWYDLIDQEIMTLSGPNRDQPALIAKGDPTTLTAPQYEPWRAGAKVVLNNAAPGIRRQLDQLRSRLLDHRFDFMLHCGAWEPQLDGRVEKDLDSLLMSWLGHDQSVSILDLSGVPSTVLDRLVGALLRIVYDALFWSREKSEGGVNRPLLIVMEEAHAYLSANALGTAKRLASRIAKEGRKYGVGSMFVSQRPSELDESILSQCGTFVALRLSNPADRERARSTVPDDLAGLMEMLPILRTGEAIVTGEATRLPMRVRITLPPEERRPDSEDPLVSDRWSVSRLPEDYEQVVTAWRAQSPRALKKHVKINRKRVKDSEG